MKNIWMLTAANIRKRKSQSITLLLFVLIATMMLNIGLILILGIGSFFDERAEESNSAHFAVIYYDDAEGIEAGKQFIKNYPGITEIEEVNVVGGYAEITANDLSTNYTFILSRYDKNQQIGAPILIGDPSPLTGDAIYVPYHTFINGGYEVGDSLKLTFPGIDFNFTIAGATEEIMFGDTMTGVRRFYISDTRYAEIERFIPDVGLLFSLTFISARLDDIEDSIHMLAEFNREVSRDDLLFTWIYAYAKQGRTMIPLVVAATICVFSSILLLVSLIVIRFRIINSIEEGMTNIGTQKAVGYRSLQIIMAIVLQFAGISIAGGFIGIILSQILLPFIIDVFRPMTALVWSPGFNPVIALFAIAFVSLTVMLISYLTSRRINKLHPLIALRGGITTHNFKKNPLPMEKSRLMLNLLLALKQILQNKKQAVTIIIIITLVTMASIIGIAANYNMNEGQEEFVRAFFGEIPEAIVYLNDDVDGEAFQQNMSERYEVRKVHKFSNAEIGMLADEVQIYVSVAEDCSLLEGNYMISGRYPRHNNEIALGTTASKVTGKGIGDTVTIRIDESSRDYIVTGIAQQMNNNGFNGLMTIDAVRLLIPDYDLSIFYLYIYDEFDIDEFLENIKESEGDIFQITLNTKEQMTNVLAGMGGAFTTISIGILAITSFVVILILYMVIKTLILRKKRELGIQKAVGFTTFQLMNQIALNMMPVIMTGIILGFFAGYYGFNPIMKLSLTGFGIVQVDLPAPLNQIILVCIALGILAYVVSMLIAWRIRKISAYSLVSE